jgi:hypothetical protein
VGTIVLAQCEIELLCRLIYETALAHLLIIQRLFITAPKGRYLLKVTRDLACI